MARSSSKNTGATIATVIVAVLAFVAVFFLIWKMGQTQQLEQDMVSDYQPTLELSTEMKTAATDLLKTDHEILILFYTKGLTYNPEPYNNLPEDGFYTCNDTKYTTFDSVKTLVESTFIASTAEKILSDPLGNGPTLGDDGGKLGLSSSFVPLEYNLSWETVSFTIDPKSDIACDLVVTLKDADGADVSVTGSMSKLNGKWLLDEIVY